MNSKSRLGEEVRRTFVHYGMALSRLDTSSLLAGFFLGSLTVVITNLLLTIHVYRVTGSSPTAVSALFVITFLPNLVVAPLCSGLADQCNRRLLLGVCGLARALFCGLLLVSWELPVLLILAFAITSISAIMKPARYALVAQITTGPERVAVNALLMIGGTAAGIVGGGVSAILTNISGREVFAIVALVSALGSLLDMVRFHHAPAPKFTQDLLCLTRDSEDTVPTSESPTSVRRRSFGRRIIDGWYLVRYTPALFALTVATTMLWFGLGVQEPLLVVFVDRVLAEPDTTYPLLATVGSVGGLLGAAAATPLASTPSAAAKSFSISLVLAGICFFVFAISNGAVTVAFVAFFLFNATYGVSNVIDEYLEQDLSPDHLRATVISAIGAVGTLGYLLGGGLAGFTAASLGAEITAAGIGLVIAGAGIYALLNLRIESEGSS